MKTINIDELQQQRSLLVEQGKEYKASREKLKTSFKGKESRLIEKMSEYALLGKQEKEYYNTFKSGVCPTCGNEIDPNKISESKEKMTEYARLWNETNDQKTKLTEEYNQDIKEIDNQINEIKDKIYNIDSQISVYNNNIKLCI